MGFNASFFDPPKKNQSQFAIRHFAGEVYYEINSFLDKNKDTLQESVLSSLSTC